MTGTHQHPDHRPPPTLTGATDRHPAWCDQTRCTADPASQAEGFRPGAGGGHRSAPVFLNLSTAMWLPVRDGTAWLTQACAPWPCESYLRVQMGDARLSVPAGNACRALDALSALFASITTTPEVTP